MFALLPWPTPIYQSLRKGMRLAIFRPIPSARRRDHLIRTVGGHLVARPLTRAFESGRPLKAARRSNANVRRHEDLQPSLSHLSLRRPSESKFRGARRNSPTATARSAGAMAPSGRTTRSESSRDRSPRDTTEYVWATKTLQNSPVSQLWVRHTLGATKAKAKTAGSG